MKKFTVESATKDVREAAKALGVKWVGVKKEVLVELVNAAGNVKKTAPAGEGQKVSRHLNHPLCQELVGLLERVDIAEAEVTRGTKNPKTVFLMTEKEFELVQAFQANGYNIKRTGDALGFSHTNVWQRLYGVEKADGKSAKGVLGKLREYVASQGEVAEAV